MTLEKLARRISGDPTGIVGFVRTAGTVEFKKDTGPIRRDLRADDFEWSPETLRNLAKILWASQRSHSYAMAALRILSKMPSSQFSPDGLLGGKGYIQSVKDIRNALGQSVEGLSAVTDTLFDEINGDHWRSVDDKEAEDLLDDSEDIKANPDGFVEQSYDDETGSEGEDHDWDDNVVVNPSPDEMNPEVAEDNSEDDEDDSDWEQSQVATEKPKNPILEIDSLPSDDSDQKFSLTAPEITKRTTIPKSGNYAAAFDQAVRRFAAESGLPSGLTPTPVMDCRGPAAGGEFGWFNGPEAAPSDDPTMEGFFSDKNLYESGLEDGITGYDNPTDGDPTVLNLGSSNYSWLPGSSNEKTMNYYSPGLTAAEIAWMETNSAPDDPMNPEKAGIDNSSAWLWENGRL